MVRTIVTGMKLNAFNSCNRMYRYMAELACRLMLQLYARLKLPIVLVHHTVAFLFFFSTDSTDSPDCLPILLSISVFYFLVFLFSTILVVGSMR